MATPPSALYVPVPTGNLDRRYGVHSTRHSTAQRVVIRISQPSRDTIKQAARALEMTEAQFMREGSLSLAKAVLLHEKEHADEDASNRSR
jgi:uncharacterized protein (DUF1778 family)